MVLDWIYQRFRRVTTGSAYLPQLDGLRFLALLMVAIVLHAFHFTDLRFYGGKFLGEGYWNNFIIEAGAGVPLFFMISGFILSLPFARWHSGLGEKPSIKHYFLRRLIRLEPPFAIVLVFLFCVQVFLLRMYTFGEHWPHLLASMSYLHIPIYQSISTVLPLSWSLEVEVQFYILAPLFCYFFRLRPVWLRRCLLVGLSLLNAWYWYNDWGLPHLLRYLHYFAGGLLLADWHLNGIGMKLSKQWLNGIGFVSLALFLFLPSLQHPLLFLLRYASMITLTYSVLHAGSFSRMFEKRLPALVGGMSYSVYLLHFAVIAALGAAVEASPWRPSGAGGVLIMLFFFSLAIFVVCSTYYLLIEQPFMRWGKRAGRPKG